MVASGRSGAGTSGSAPIDIRSGDGSAIHCRTMLVNADQLQGVESLNSPASTCRGRHGSTARRVSHAQRCASPCVSGSSGRAAYCPKNPRAPQNCAAADRLGRLLIEAHKPGWRDVIEVRNYLTPRQQIPLQRSARHIANPNAPLQPQRGRSPRSLAQGHPHRLHSNRPVTQVAGRHRHRHQQPVDPLRNHHPERNLIRHGLFGQPDEPLQRHLPPVRHFAIS